MKYLLNYPLAVYKAFAKVFEMSSRLIIHVLSLLNIKKIKKKSLIFNLILSQFIMFGITGGVHRYWCHNSYETNIYFEIILMLLFSGSLSNSIE